jgi:epoxyqueuosine reductase
LTDGLTAEQIRELARICGFELSGVAAAAPSPDSARYHEWVAAGFAGEMRYLTDRRAQLRDDPRNLLASARSVICVGKLYNTPLPYSTEFREDSLAWISRYAWGDDYHDAVRRGLERLDAMLRERAAGTYESKICVDTAPLLERSYARAAGLGWIGKNTCLISQGGGSWFFLGEILTSLELVPGTPPPDRCGSCTRCIDACPTAAIDPDGYALDARRCISYLTIELRSAVPEEWREAVGRHVFGCDICQDVCPWNRRAPVTDDAAFAPREFAPPLERLAAIEEAEFRAMFRGAALTRARYSGFLRNVAVAMGAQCREEFRVPLMKLAASPDEAVAEHARWALQQLSRADPGTAPKDHPVGPRRGLSRENFPLAALRRKNPSRIF